MSPVVRQLELMVQTLAGDLGSLVRGMVPALYPQAGAFPQCELDPMQPITARTVADTTGLSLVRGAADTDLRSTAWNGVDVLLRGSRAGRTIELLSRRLSRTLFSTRSASDARLRVRAAFPLPIFECDASLPYALRRASLTELPVLCQEVDPLTHANVVLRADPRDAETLRAIWPMLVALLRGSLVRVHSDGQHLVLMPIAMGSDVAFHSPNRCIDSLIAIAEQLERGSADGATVSMKALAPARRIDPHPMWTQGLGNDTSRAALNGLIGGALLLGSFVMVIAQPVKALAIFFLAVVFFAAAAWGVWKKLRTRLVLHEDAFEWQPPVGAARTIRYADVLTHHRVSRAVGRNWWISELVVLHRSGELVVSTPAAGELACRLDEREQS